MLKCGKLVARMPQRGDGNGADADGMATAGMKQVWDTLPRRVR